jgi:hypothetical protein
MQVYNDESLYHYGKMGMKWGHRKSYGTMPRMLTAKRQLSADKKTLNMINNGGHTSVGLTKNRQAAYDKRDKAILEKRIAKNTDKLEFRKEYKQMQKDQILHPIHSTAEQLKLLKNKPLKALNLDLKTAKELNEAVKNRVEAESKKKKAISQYKKEINAGESLIGKIYNKLTDADRYQAEMMYNHRNK